MKMISIKILVLASLLAIGAFGVLGQQAQEDTIDDQQIKVTDFADMEYPLSALISGMQGITVVRATLDDKGNVVDAVALSGGRYLIENSVENAKKWKFEPNDKKAAIIVYNFRIEGVCHPRKDGPSQMIFYPPNFVTVTNCPFAPRY